MSNDQVNGDREQRIRERAYALWEQEGRPQGEDLRHWIAALAEISGEGTDQNALQENLSVLGDPEGSSRAQGDVGKKSRARSGSATVKKRSGTGKTTASQITTGQEDAHVAVRHVEGP